MRIIGLRIASVLLFVVCAMVLPDIARVAEPSAEPPQVIAGPSVDLTKIDLELWRQTYLRTWAEQNATNVNKLLVHKGDLTEASCAEVWFSLYPQNIHDLDDLHSYDTMIHEATHALSMCENASDDPTGEAVAEVARHLVRWELTRTKPGFHSRYTHLWIADIINNLDREVVGSSEYFYHSAGPAYVPAASLMTLLADRMPGHTLKAYFENLLADPMTAESYTESARRLDQVIEGRVNGVLPSTYYGYGLTGFTAHDGLAFSLFAWDWPTAFGWEQTLAPVNPQSMCIYAFERKDGNWLRNLDAWMRWEVSDPAGKNYVSRNSEIKNGVFFDEVPSSVEDDTTWPTAKGAYKLTGCILNADGCSTDPNLSDTSFFIQWGQWWPRWDNPILEDWTKGKMFIITNGPSYQELGDELWRKLELVDPDPILTVERYPGLLVVELNGSDKDVVVTDGENIRTFTPHSWLTTIYLWTRRAQPFLKAVTNAATYGEEPLTPGGIYTAWTWGASHQDPHSNEQDPETETLPNACLDTRVVLMASGKEYSAPIFYCDMYQVNFQVPYELDGASKASVSVELRGVPSNSLTVAVAPASPGIFIMAQGEPPVGAVLDMSGRLVTADNPVRPGDFVSIYSTGLGTVRPYIETGKAMGAAVADLSVTTLQVSAEVSDGAKPCPVLYSGLAPGFVGLYQVNLMIPDLQEGSYSLSLTVDGKRSNEILLPVAP